MKRTLAAALAAVLLATAGMAAAEDDMATAREFLENRLYAESLYYLRAAADTGDAQAAEILGFMYSFGPELFPGVARDPAAAAHWLGIAARAGRPAARYMVRKATDANRGR